MSVKYTYTATKAGQSVSAASIRELNVAMNVAWGFPGFRCNNVFNVYQWRHSNFGIDITREHVPTKPKQLSGKLYAKWVRRYRISVVPR